MVSELQRIRAVCARGPLVSLPYWLCQPACYHTHTHRGGIARKAKKKIKKMNERTNAQQFQTTSRGNDREPHSSTLEMEISQLARLAARATTGTDEAPFFVGTSRKKHTLIHAHHQYQHRSSAGGAENPCEPRSSSSGSGGGEQKQPETKANRAAYALTIHGKEGNSLAELPQYMGRLVLRRSLPSSCSSHSLRDAMLQAYDVRLPHP